MDEILIIKTALFCCDVTMVYLLLKIFNVQYPTLHIISKRAKK